MRHVVLPGAPATGPYRMGQAPAAARLVAPTGGTLGVISGLLRTAAGTIDLTAVAAAANKHLRSTTDTNEQPGRRLHPRGLAHAWTTITMLGIMPRQACSARCGARRRSGTWRFRSASCLPIRQVVNAQLCARSTSSHLRRTPACGYVDNASALPTDPQDQKQSKRQFDCFGSTALKPGLSQPRPAAATPVAAFGIYARHHSHPQWRRGLASSWGMIWHRPGA